MPARSSGTNRPRDEISTSSQHGALLRLFHVLVEVAEGPHSTAADVGRQPSESGDDRAGKA